MNSKIKAVVFDIDDTLYPAEECYEYGRIQLGLYCKDKFGFFESEFNEYFSEAKKITKSKLGNVASSHNRFLYVQTLCELAGINPLVHALEMYDIYWGAAIEHLVIYPYVIPLMSKIKSQDLKIGLLSDLTAHIQFRKKQKLGIAQYVDAIVTSEEAGEEKPSDRMFSLILKKLNVSASEALMIGDNTKKDILGAQNIGMNYYHVQRQYLDKIEKDIMEIIDD